MKCHGFTRHTNEDGELGGAVRRCLSSETTVTVLLPHHDTSKAVELRSPMYCYSICAFIFNFTGSRVPYGDCLKPSYQCLCRSCGSLYLYLVSVIALCCLDADATSLFEVLSNSDRLATASLLLSKTANDIRSFNF